MAVVLPLCSKVPSLDMEQAKDCKFDEPHMQAVQSSSGVKPGQGGNLRLTAYSLGAGRSLLSMHHKVKTSTPEKAMTMLWTI